MAVYEIPLSSEPQKLTIQLGSLTYQLTVWWSVFANIWNINIADDNGVMILSGIPLTTGADLLEQFQYMSLGGKLYATTVDAPLEPPSYENLGGAGKLLFETT